MKNFGRVLRLTLQRRFTFALSLGCALLVGVLWGGNIAAMYPFLEVAFEGRGLQEWVTDEIASAEQKVVTLQEEIAGLRASGEDQQTKISLLQSRIEAEQQALSWYRWAQPGIERWLPRTPFRTLVLLTGVLLFGTILKSIFFIIQSVLVAQLTQHTIFNLRSAFYRRSLNMELASFDTDGTSELMSRFTYDMDSLAGGIRALLGKAVREPLKMVACLIGAGFICWRLLLLSLIVAPLAIFVVGKLAKLLKRANRKAMEEMAQLYGILEETFQGIKIVKAFTTERHERRRFHLNSKKFFDKSMKIARYDALTRPVTELMGISTICLALLAGAYLVLNQETHLLGIRMSDRPLDLSSLLVFYGLLAGVSDPARKLSEVFGRISRAAAAADRIYALMDRQATIVDPETPRPLPRHHRELVFDDIHFSYVPGTPVVEGVSLSIKAGETVAFVGPNGCGKSTLMNLVPRFFDPVSGSVRLDGVDLRDVRMRDLRRQIGLVTQETTLFDGTVLNNIRYGAPDATDEQVIEAAKQAHAHRFITERLERGYETMVGARGSMLSGGQRQRIALARAILRDPAILLLDEATSQVDLESEQVIHKVLEKFTQGRTTLLITHRMSTLALADRIVVMEHGRILDVGSHDQLVMRCPLYSRLHEIGFRQIA